MKHQIQRPLVVVMCLFLWLGCEGENTSEDVDATDLSGSGGLPFTGEPAPEEETSEEESGATKGQGEQIIGRESVPEEPVVQVACGVVGAPCDDQQSCTSDDTCQESGLCEGDDILCEDGVICTEDFCSGGSCIHKVVDEYCLIEGECYPDETVNPDGGCSVCDSETQPEAWTLGGDAQCDDGDSCTLNDKCSGSGCVGTLIPCDDEDPCTMDSCDDGVCVFDADPACGPPQCDDEAQCDDGDICTMDFCDNGVCLFTPIQGCDASGQGECDTTADCVNLDPCKVVTCVQGECLEALQSNIPCEDGDLCTVGDVCMNGQCLAGTNLPDADLDGYPAKSCGGTDCNDSVNTISPGEDEVCGDGIDNDCNNLIDDADPACEDIPEPPETCDYHKECPEDQLCGYWPSLDKNQCSSLCASTADCSDNMICAPVPGSANVGMCRPSVVPGSQGGGAQCATGGECKSELCAGVCASFCSGDNACPGASTCYPAGIGEEIVGICAPDSTYPGGLSMGQSCGNDGGNCFSGHCDFLGDGTCAPLCGTDGDCSFDQECGLILRSNVPLDYSIVFGDRAELDSFKDKTYDTLLGCFQRPVVGSLPVGSVCTQPDECRSNKCLPLKQSLGDSTGYCSAFCTSDSDCPGTMACRPGVTTVASNWLALYGTALETKGTIARICKFPQ